VVLGNDPTGQNDLCSHDVSPGCCGESEMKVASRHRLPESLLEWARVFTAASVNPAASGWAVSGWKPEKLKTCPAPYNLHGFSGFEVSTFSEFQFSGTHGGWKPENLKTWPAAYVLHGFQDFGGQWAVGFRQGGKKLKNWKPGLGFMSYMGFQNFRISVSRGPHAL
jgi:hypothetical protein